MAESNGEQIPEEQQMDQEVQGEAPATDEPMETETYVRTDNFDKYLGMGFAEKVAEKLDQVVTDLMGQGTLSEPLDDRALEALKEMDDESAIAVLKQFCTSNLTHVHNKSAFICGVIKTFRLKSRRPGGAATPGEPQNGPDEAKIKEMLQKTGYSLDITTGQRKYGGPPPNWEGEVPGVGCEVFIGKIPRDTFEDTLVPLLEKCGKIYDLRLMMDLMTGLNRGYAFTTFCDKAGALECVKQLDKHHIKEGWQISCNISIPKSRLFVGSVPKNKTKEEIKQEFESVTEGLQDVIIYYSSDDKKRNRGFAFLEYDSHRSANTARRQLMSGKVRVWNIMVTVDWADPISEPDEETMAKVKVVYVRNLSTEANEENIKEAFQKFGEVEKVKKMKDYCFIHFMERDCAMKAIEEMNGTPFHGSDIEVSLAKPAQENKKKKERQMKQQQGYQGGGRYYDEFYGGRGGRGRGGAPRGRGGYDRQERGYNMSYGGGYDDGYYGWYEEPVDYQGYYERGYDSFGYGGRGQGPRGRGGPRGGRGGAGMGGPRGGPGNRGGPRGGARARGQMQRGGRGGGGGRGGRGGGGRGGSIGGKRKFEGQQPGDTKRRNTQGNWGSPPIAQQPLNDYPTSYEYGQSYGEQSWSQDNYGAGF